MERFDCPIHSGPLVVLEEIAKGCGCSPSVVRSAFIHTRKLGDTYLLVLPVVIPVECIRIGSEIECPDCVRITQPRYATRPYVEETVTA